MNTKLLVLNETSNNMIMAFDKYAYNTRSEVTGAHRYHGADVSDTSQVYGGREFGYDYDPIGNRTSATETIGGETLTKGYTANALNQYTAIANPDAVGLRGSATNTATVTVNGNAVERDNTAAAWTPWHHALQADNANGPDYTFAEIMAVINPPGTNTPDIVSTDSGHIYVPPQTEALTYDDDGNLLSDGRFNYTWNGENRLVKAVEKLSPPTRQPYVVEYAYDHQGRMVRKTVAAPNSPPSKTITYLWDDFNIIAETVQSGSGTNTAYNIWGLDLDGTLQGAGGVGGLLAVVKDSAAYIPAWDANGNVMKYVATDGAIAAHREYDPFGGTVVVTGDTDGFTHWFSTKPWCSVTGLSEYQYRKYSPALGRWMSRDPIGEKRGANLYSINENRPVDNIDYLGLFGCSRRPDPKSLALTKESVSISVHGSRFGGDLAFDGRAKRSAKGGQWSIVETGKELFDLLAQKSKSDDNCCHCIESLVIHSHASGAGISMRWDSGFGITKPDSISPMPSGESEATRGREGEARDISDLKNAIDAKEIVFCSPCTIRLYGCWTGDDEGLGAALSKVTPCQVIAPVGRCYPVDSEGNMITENSGGVEVAGGSDEWRSWTGGVSSPYPGPVPY